MTNSDVLVEVVVRAMREAINDSPRLAALHDVGEEYHGEQKKMLYVDGALDLESIARAAIEAMADIVGLPKPLGIEEVVERFVPDVAALLEHHQTAGATYERLAHVVTRAIIEAYEQATLSGSPEG